MEFLFLYFYSPAAAGSLFCKEYGWMDDGDTIDTPSLLFKWGHSHNSATIKYMIKFSYEFKLSLRFSNLPVVHSTVYNFEMGSSNVIIYEFHCLFSIWVSFYCSQRVIERCVDSCILCKTRHYKLLVMLLKTPTRFLGWLATWRIKKLS